MEPCEYCKSYQAVMWDLDKGFICMDCHRKHRALERQKALDDEREQIEQIEAKFKFWHE